MRKNGDPRDDIRQRITEIAYRHRDLHWQMEHLQAELNGLYYALAVLDGGDEAGRPWRPKLDEQRSTFSEPIENLALSLQARPGASLADMLTMEIPLADDDPIELFETRPATNEDRQPDWSWVDSARARAAEAIS